MNTNRITTDRTTQLIAAIEGIIEACAEIPEELEGHLESLSEAVAAAKPILKLVQSDEAAYHAWAGAIADEAIIRRAASLMEDAVADLAYVEDKELVEALTASKTDLLAMQTNQSEAGQ